MKIIAISDLHGYLPSIKEKADILCICGDISPLNIQFNKPEMLNWLHGPFMEWIKSVPVEKVYLIAGNHDAWFEGASKAKLMELQFLSSNKLVYLDNEVTHYIDDNGKLWSIFGTPYCKVFGTWPFMRTEETLVEKYAEIPDEVDIILSHDTPYGVGGQDLILETVRWSNHNLKHIGNKPLVNRLKDVKYKILFHGHIHSSSHCPDEFGTGKVVNVSVVDESYDLVYDPYILEINECGD